MREGTGKPDEAAKGLTSTGNREAIAGPRITIRWSGASIEANILCTTTKPSKPTKTFTLREFEWKRKHC
jgi:hypothetical protein